MRGPIGIRHGFTTGPDPGAFTLSVIETDPVPGCAVFADKPALLVPTVDGDKVPPVFFGEGLQFFPGPGFGEEVGVVIPCAQGRAGPGGAQELDTPRIDLCTAPRDVDASGREVTELLQFDFDHVG